MGGYSEGKHDDPAGTKDRLVKIGTKYQATAPAVSDGDNVYILVDPAGRVITVGAAASDAPVVGNPFPIAGVVDQTSPAVAAEGDVRYIRVSPEGHLISTNITETGLADGLSARRMLDFGDNTVVGGTALMALAPDNSYDRLKVLGDVGEVGGNILAAAPWTPGASDVKVARLVPAAASTTREAIATPASGKKVRIIAVQAFSASTTGTRFEVYFATGANIGTTAGKEIANWWLDLTDHPTQVITYPDGGGPVGAADDVVSVRTSGDITTSAEYVVLYREE